MNYSRPSFLRPVSGYLYALLILLLATSCGGTLSDEQRKKMREEMELHQIRRVTEVEITEAALERGRAIMAIIEKTKTPQAADSVAKITKTKIHWIAPGKENAPAIEQQLIEAYIAGAETGSLQDNIQKLRADEGEPDSILYTRPVVKNMPDGSVQVQGTWNIRLSQKELILSMGKKKK